MLWTWFFTVATSMKSRVAISLLERPWAIRSTIWRSRVVSADASLDARRVAADEMRRSSVVAIRGGKLASRRAALSTLETSSPIGASGSTKPRTPSSANATTVGSSLGTPTATIAGAASPPISRILSATSSSDVSTTTTSAAAVTLRSPSTEDATVVTLSWSSLPRRAAIPSRCMRTSETTTTRIARRAHPPSGMSYVSSTAGALSMDLQDLDRCGPSNPRGGRRRRIRPCQ
jgi:hypothetical protein